MKIKITLDDMGERLTLARYFGGNQPLKKADAESLLEAFCIASIQSTLAEIEQAKAHYADESER